MEQIPTLGIRTRVTSHVSRACHHSTEVNTSSFLFTLPNTHLFHVMGWVPISLYLLLIINLLYFKFEINLSYEYLPSNNGRNWNKFGLPITYYVLERFSYYLKYQIDENRSLDDWLQLRSPLHSVRRGTMNLHEGSWVSCVRWSYRKVVRRIILNLNTY